MEIIYMVHMFDFRLKDRQLDNAFSWPFSTLDKALDFISKREESSDLMYDGPRNEYLSMCIYRVHDEISRVYHILRRVHK